MLSARLIILFVQKESLGKIFLWLMGLGIFVLLDTLATLALAAQVGAYLAVALVGVFTWVGLGIFFASLARHIKLLRNAAARGILAQMEFAHISGLCLGALLIIVPGLVTDVLGWLCYLQPFRLFVGKLIYKRFEPEFEQVNQHLAVEDVSSSS